MSSIETKPAFLERFDLIWTKMRRTHVGQAIWWAVLIGSAGLGILAAFDYWLEVGRNDRAAGLAVVACVSLALAVAWTLRALRQWSRPKTATEIEQRFPELGQAVRTAVEFGARSPDRLGAEGLKPSLVSALAADAEQRAAPLRIDSIVPVGRLRLTAGLALGLILILLTGMAVSWEWRVATLRALLGEQVYTELTVSPGDLTVEEGDGLTLAIAVAGRTSRTVVVATRPLGSQEGWTERELTAAEAVSSEPRLVRYETSLPRIIDSLEYRVSAGPARSERYRIDVKHPLAIERVEAEVTPPAYTGLAPSVVEQGNLTVIDGSTVRLGFTLDRRPKTAKMVLTERGVRLGPGERPKVQELPLAIDGAYLSATLELQQDQTYTIVAEAADGMYLPKNKFSIRVRFDQPPKVWFETPREALEVHSLAEVLLRIRYRDDFGLTRAGIVFEVNNESKYTLAAEDYTELAGTLGAEGQPTRQTRDALQRLLPLEVFDLEEKDSVTYYGFAEDNFPGGSHRSETDLRFIDIRPFRRIYRLPDPTGQGGGNPINFPQVRSLQEIIARQRFNLNRTIRLDRKAAAGSEPTILEVDRIATFEDDLSKSTHELAEFLDEREFDGSDLLFQAETVMLNAVDSLNVSKYDISSQQQKDALRLLIEGRNTLERFLRTATAAQRNALRNFSRGQLQRLRRPNRKKEDDEDPERLVQRIRRLAAEQDFVYRSLTMLADAQATSGGGGERDDEPEEDDDGQPTEESGDTDSDMDAAESDNDSANLSLAEIAARQQDLAVETRDVETVLNRIRNMSELARRRGTFVADAADEVSGAVGRGRTGEAAETARQTSEMLRELAINVEGLLSSAATQKIAMSRDLAGMLAALERRLAEEVAGGEEVGSSGYETGPRNEELDMDRLAEAARRAASLAEGGMTMKDILDSAVETDSPADRQAAQRVNELLSDGGVDETVERMVAVRRMLDDRRGRDARLEARDAAERLDVLARQLDQLYRSIVTPRLEQLMVLEARAANAEEGLKKLQTNEQISTWHRRALELMEDLDKAKAVGDSLDELTTAMREEGWSKMADRRRWNWKRGAGGNYSSPASYGRAMRSIVDDIQQRMQELVLTDLVADDNEPTPPKYKRLVDEYMKVLSSDGGSAQ